MATTLLDLLRDDHAEIRALLARIEDTAPDERGELFAQVVAVLARHEAAERAIVHPLTRRTPQGTRVADSVIRAEQHLEELLARMQDMDPHTEGFLNAFRQLRTAVEDHARHEEETEFPRLAAAYSQAELERHARRFRRFEQVAPTRPHPHAPNDGLGQRLVAPVAGAVDRMRDTVRVLLS